jgi:hypothetical protein
MSFTVPPGPLAPLVRLDDFRSAVRPDPPVDPDAVWDEVAAAARLFGSLRSAGMSVRFDCEDRSGPPRVTITDLAGRVLRDVPAALACDPEALEAELLGPAA